MWWTSTYQKVENLYHVPKLVTILAWCYKYLPCLGTSFKTGFSCPGCQDWRNPWLWSCQSSSWPFDDYWDRRPCTHHRDPRTPGSSPSEPWLRTRWLELECLNSAWAPWRFILRVSGKERLFLVPTPTSSNLRGYEKDNSHDQLPTPEPTPEPSFPIQLLPPESQAGPELLPPANPVDDLADQFQQLQYDIADRLVDTSFSPYSSELERPPTRPSGRSEPQDSTATKTQTFNFCWPSDRSHHWRKTHKKASGSPYSRFYLANTGRPILGFPYDFAHIEHEN